MMFNRLALIKAAEDEISARAAAQQLYVDQENEKRRAAADTWHTEYAQEWLNTLGNLRKKLRAGLPLYASDLPRQREWRSIAVFGDQPRPPVEPRTVDASDLRNLIAVLTALSDDQVSTSGLAAIGVTPKALRGTIQRLGRTERTEN
jgi:Fe-S-cluster formation regulator IscX/YfhJ